MRGSTSAKVAGNPTEPSIQIAEQVSEWPALTLRECTLALALLAKCQGMIPDIGPVRPIDERIEVRDRHAARVRRRVGTCERRVSGRLSIRRAAKAVAPARNKPHRP